MPIILAWKVKTGGSPFENSPGKVSMRVYLKNKLKAKGLGEWLKWWSIFWVQSPLLQKTKMSQRVGDLG
jgi:hypothetical protein